MYYRDQNGTSLTDEQIRKYAPSVFAESPHPDMSARYRFHSTHNVLSRLRDEGFEPVAVNQSRSRKPDGKSFAKHQLTFRSPEYFGRKAVVGDVIPEILVTNAHDGRSPTIVNFGLFRFVCANGAVVADSTVAAVKVQHRGQLSDNVIEGVFTVISESDRALATIDTWRRTPISTVDALQYAKEAAQLKWSGEIPFDTSRLLARRRPEDEVSTLYGAFQIVQEHLMKGGISYGKRRSTRSVKTVDANLNLNTRLWELTEKFAA